MYVLVINCGSATVKYALVDGPTGQVAWCGLMERIGQPQALWHHHQPGAGHDGPSPCTLANHQAAFDQLFPYLASAGLLEGPQAPQAVGHRVVHGGTAYQAPALVTAQVRNTIRELIPLAPLHNPLNLLGLESSAQRLPHLPQVAVFDTAFHQTLPPAAFRYALPNDCYTAGGVRRYGFHGISHQSAVRQAQAVLHLASAPQRLITLHLGNGASAAAIRQGQCVHTSMGFGPLAGLVMGTRSGDVDPSVVFHLARQPGWDLTKVETLLNHDSGLKGMAGTADMREVHTLAKAGDENARLALEVFVGRIRHYLGAYLVELGGVEAVVFTGGIGQNDPAIRQAVCQGLEELGLLVDEVANQRQGPLPLTFHRLGSSVALLAVEANEEAEIARQTALLLGKLG